MSTIIELFLAPTFENVCLFPQVIKLELTVPIRICQELIEIHQEPTKGH